jgi:hypothetical protein
MTEDFSVRRDRREHGGAGRPDDDALAARTEQERVDAGVADYNPDAVPPATDPAPEGTAEAYDPLQSEEFLEERAEFRRQEAEGEVYPITEENPYPPTRYSEQ